MTDDERMQLIRERDAAWERDRLFAADGGLIGDTRYLLQRLDAVTAERDAYRAAIVEHNEPIAREIKPVEEQLATLEKMALIVRADGAMAEFRDKIERLAREYLRVNGEVVR